MDDQPSTSPVAIEPQSTGSSLISWLAASAVATIALSLMAAHSPPRIRLLGLSSIAFGAFIGWMLDQLADKLDVTPSYRLTSIAAIVLTLGGLIGCTWETARLENARQLTSGKEALAERLIEQMRMQQNAGELPQVDSSALMTFRRHLARRIQRLGTWSSPWPETFWIVELFAAASASVWMSHRGRLTR